MKASLLVNTLFILFEGYCKEKYWRIGKFMPIILLLVIQGYVQNYVTHVRRLINQSVYVILMLARE